MDAIYLDIEISNYFSLYYKVDFQWVSTCFLNLPTTSIDLVPSESIGSLSGKRRQLCEWHNVISGVVNNQLRNIVLVCNYFITLQVSSPWSCFKACQNINFLEGLSGKPQLYKVSCCCIGVFECLRMSKDRFASSSNQSIFWFEAVTITVWKNIIQHLSARPLVWLRARRWYLDWRTPCDADPPMSCSKLQPAWGRKPVALTRKEADLLRQWGCPTQVLGSQFF